MRAGVIRNPMSHANRREGEVAAPHPDVLFAQPERPHDVAAEVMRFAEAGCELIVIDGGDGTVREVLSALPAAFGDTPPLLSVVASGKTNILAFDLGVRGSWTLEAALAAAGQPDARIRLRSPLQVMRDSASDPPLSGFVFGCAALVRQEALASGLHRAHVFHNLSVALTLAGAVSQVMAGGEDNPWRRGEPVTLTVDDEPARSGPRLLAMATTLQRLPFRMRPFGPPRHGLKFLDADAPPRHLARAVPTVLWGRGEGWLRKNGYRRGDAHKLRFQFEGSMFLDGEVYPGGDLTVTEGPRLRFLTP
jgi:diacylglycerol kinase (ATP)